MLAVWSSPTEKQRLEKQSDKRQQDKPYFRQVCDDPLAKARRVRQFVELFIQRREKTAIRFARLGCGDGGVVDEVQLNSECQVAYQWIKREIENYAWRSGTCETAGNSPRVGGQGSPA